MVKILTSRKLWDTSLLTLTFISLLILGCISLGGIIFSWWKNLTEPTWQETWLYPHYLNLMNSYALPMALVLTFLTILCLPKRLANQKLLLCWLAATILFSLLASIPFGWKGFLILSFGSSLFASVSTLFLLMLRPEQLKFQKEGWLSKLGSLLLHSGFIVFIANIAIFYESSTPLKLFWIAFALIVTGNFLLFCPQSFKTKRKARLLRS